MLATKNDPAGSYVFSAVVGTARCAVRAPYEGRNMCVTSTCGAIGSARSDAGGDIAARCPYPRRRHRGEGGAGQPRGDDRPQAPFLTRGGGFPCPGGEFELN